jgi:hypothetical protein
MWRNGRRNGLKIRSREKRGMGSNPIIGTSENAIFIGQFVRRDGPGVHEWSRTETHEKAVYLSSIRQVSATRLRKRWRVCACALADHPERSYRLS